MRSSQLPLVRPEGDAVGRVGDAVIESGSLDVSCEQLMAGPIASMGGIVLGELVIVARCYTGVRDWKALHA